MNKVSIIESFPEDANAIYDFQFLYEKGTKIAIFEKDDFFYFQEYALRTFGNPIFKILKSAIPIEINEALLQRPGILERRSWKEKVYELIDESGIVK